MIRIVSASEKCSHRALWLGKGSLAVAAIAWLLGVGGVPQAAANPPAPAAPAAPAVCFPGADITCSPKVEQKTAKPSEAKPLGVLFRKDSAQAPPSPDGYEVIPLAGDQGSGQHSYAVPVTFTGLAASVTVDVVYTGLARAVGTGTPRACQLMLLDVKKGSDALTMVNVGSTCNSEHSTISRRFVLTGLEPGASYTITPRVACSYMMSNVRTQGFVCSFQNFSATLVWPFGNPA